MEFSAVLSNDGNELTLSINGRFDFNLYTDFRNAYLHLPASTRFIIDLGKTTFIDSSAIGMMLLLREHAGEKAANIRLINCNMEIKKILAIAKIAKMFVIE